MDKMYAAEVLINEFPLVVIKETHVEIFMSAQMVRLVPYLYG